jgi:hypothetical protein
MTRAALCGILADDEVNRWLIITMMLRRSVGAMVGYATDAKHIPRLLPRNARCGRGLHFP